MHRARTYILKDLKFSDISIYRYTLFIEDGCPISTVAMTANTSTLNLLLYAVSFFRCSECFFYKKRCVIYKQCIISYVLISQLFLIFLDFLEYILMQRPLVSLKCLKP